MTVTSQTPETTASTWNLDPAHSAAEFKVRHMMISNVKGQFTGLAGVLTLDESDIAKSSVEATIDASTVSTHEAQRDGHLKSPDFFNIELYPTLKFHSKQVTRTGVDELDVTGDLTINAISREVVFKVEGPSPVAKDPWGNTRIGMSAHTKINRKDYGLHWNAVLEAGGILVGEDITITLDLQFIKA